ncbi:MAG: hypothetical protein Q7U97_12165 [Rhodocyclaceae bacterium]|nr:hypothetical protein [Rhodocyclaceae bacterium]
MNTAAKIRKQLFARAGNEAARLAYERSQKDKHAAKVTEQQFLARHPEILMEELAIEAKRKALMDDEIVKYFQAHPKIARDIIQHEAMRVEESPKATRPTRSKAASPMPVVSIPENLRKAVLPMPVVSIPEYFRRATDSFPGEPAAPVFSRAPVMRARSARGRSMDPVVDAEVVVKTPLAGAKAKKTVIAKAKAAQA